ncbi:sensor domain-containing protein [Notoacmeibacter ruber]|nr:EAL domain-containing protein [Notoacmeibacter ruber]
MKQIRRILAKERSQLRGITSRIRADQFDKQTARELRSERVTALMSNLMPFTVFNTIVMIFIATWFLDRGIDLILYVWGALHIALSAIVIFSKAKRDPGRPYSGSPRTTKKIVTQTILVAACWSVCFYFLIPVSKGEDALILNGLAVGGVILGPTVLHPVPAAALTWLATTTLLNTGAFVLFGGNNMIIASVMNVAFTCVAGLNCLKQADYMTRQFAIRQSLKEKQDMIALLLKEYEDGVRTWPWECDSYGHMTRLPDAMKNLLERFHRSYAWNIRDLANLVEEKTSVSDGVEQQLHINKRIAQILTEPRKFHDYQFPVRLEEGRQIWFSLSGKPTYGNDGAFLGYRGLISDVTETKLAEQKVQFLATHDPLTELPNRNLYSDILNGWIGADRPFACLHIDLDRFKVVNDSLGHGAGDDLLVGVARRLEGCAEKVTSQAVCARIGGDEFLMALPLTKDEAGAVDEEIVAQMAQKIIDCLSQPFELTAGTVTIGASLGYSLFPDDALELADLDNRADLALYRAKSKGRGQFTRYLAGMDRRAQNRKKLEVSLRGAIAGGEIHLVYQPVIELQSGRVKTVEVLSRWKSPSHGFVSPQLFIPLAEESGLIHQIGQWVLEQSCREAASWNDNISLAVNVSAIQILRPDFPETVLRILEETGLDASRLELELTETVLVQEADLALQTIAKLRKNGIRIILDDFGTGYSSLSYLHAFAFDKIKVDRSFIMNLRKDPEKGGSRADALVRGIVSLGQMLEVPVTAEGIEEEWQAEELRKLGCDYGQGYLFSRPVSIAKLRSIIGMSHGFRSSDPTPARSIA